MNTKLRSSKLIAPLAGSICGLLVLTSLIPLLRPERGYGTEPAPRRARGIPAQKAEAEKPKETRPPDAALHAGFDYLLAQQHPDGGWGQGGGWRQDLNGKSGRVEGAKIEDPSDLGSTCLSLVALLRSGDSPKAGAHREAATKAFEFVCRQVEKADVDSLYVTPVRDTQLQVKIGQYVDTFLTAWALSEVKGKLADENAETRRAAALEKVVRKIEKNQGQDGSFAGNTGWASVLSQGLASKALNAASRTGANVSASALERDLRQNTADLDAATGAFRAPAAATAPSNAGVSLYWESSKLGALEENSKSNTQRKQAAEQVLADASSAKPEKDKAEQSLKKIEGEELANKAAKSAIAGKLRDERYVAGFGNNGGEEFLSYLNLTESLHTQGGKDWIDWRAKMQTTVCGAQNRDGSWAGQHCITGRTFCTSAALLTLLVDRNGDAGKTAAAETPGKP